MTLPPGPAIVALMAEPVGPTLDQFQELGSIYGVFHYLVRNGIRLGMRLQSRPQRGQLTWRRPVLATLNQRSFGPV